MTKSLPVTLLASAALLSGTAAFATTTKAATKTVATRTTTKTTATKGRMVTTRLANGKTVTYNCALAGNATKTACKS